MTAPKQDVRFGAIILRNQAPVRGIWCKPPDAKNKASTACVYTSAACGGETGKICPHCHFPFCQTHLPGHSKPFECPADVWREFDQRRRLWYKKVKANPKARPRVNVQFPDVEVEAHG